MSVASVFIPMSHAGPVDCFSAEDAEQGKILSRANTECVFALSREEWEQYVPKFEAPRGSLVRTSPSPQGTSIMVLDETNQTGLLVSPMYLDGDSSPVLLLIGNYFAPGAIQMDDEFLRSLKEQASIDVGDSFSVLVSKASVPPLEGIEFTITRSSD